MKKYTYKHKKGNMKISAAGVIVPGEGYASDQKIPKLDALVKAGILELVEVDIAALKAKAAKEEEEAKKAAEEAKRAEKAAKDAKAKAAKEKKEAEAAKKAAEATKKEEE